MRRFFTFDFSHLRGDLFGGLTAGIVALPLALAFGAQTALGPMAGLYGAIAIAILAALFGGTPTQISGPTAPMTVVSGAIIATALVQTGADTVADALPVIIGIFFLAGVFELLFGVLKLGRYIRYIPYSVVSGFMSGIGVIIIITQLFPLLGYRPAEDVALVQQRLPHAEEVLLEQILREEEQAGLLSGVMSTRDIEETTRRARLITPQDIEAEARKQASREASGTVGTIQYLSRPFSIPGGIHWLNLLLAVITVIIIYGFKRITTVVPSSLVALVVVTLGAYFLLPGQVPTIGQVQEGLPPLYLDFFGVYFSSGMLGTIVEFALTLAALGAIDSLLTSVVADNITRTQHDSNQELIGQGLGNMAAALIGGLPGAGATMRTVVNVQSGGVTKISGVLSGIFLLAVLLGLSPLVSVIPTAVLAGILLTVGIGIIDYKGLRRLRAIPRTDAVIMVVVLVLTVFVGLLEAVAIGMVMASLLFMKNISDVIGHRTQVATFREFARETPWPDEGDIIDRVGDRVYIKHLDGPLFFGFASRFQEMIKALPNVSVVIMRMSRVPYVDQSGLYAMEDAVVDLQKQGIGVVFTGLRGQPLDMFERINLVPGLVSYEYCFDTFEDCRRWLSTYLDTNESFASLAEQQLSTPPLIGDKIDEI